MNYNEMTADQCADWLAEKDGWTFKYNSWWHPTIIASFHPYPLTLDAAAGALREPWGWGRVLWWKTSVRAVIYQAITCKKIMTEGHDEMTARYRAAVAARMEDDK